MISAEKAEELKRLLDEAITNLTISDRFGSRSMSVDQYRSNLVALWDSFRPELALHIGRFSPRVTDESAHQKLTIAITDSFGNLLREGRIQLAGTKILGGSFPGYELPLMLRRLIDVSLVRGSSSTVERFVNYLDGRPARYRVVTLLNGINVDTPVEVAPGIQLMRLPSSSSELPPFLTPMHGRTADYFLGRTVLVVERTIAPVFSNPERFGELLEGAFDDRSLSEEVSDLDIDLFCDALSLATNSSVEWTSIWNHFHGDDLAQLGREYHGGSQVIQNRGLLDRRSTHAGSDQVRSALELYLRLNDMHDDLFHQLRIPIKRWVKAKGERIIEDAMIDLGIALESIYLRDINEPGELTLRLRIRAAWFLGKNASDRQSVMNSMGKTYKLRSSAVHTGTTGDTANSEAIRASAEDLCLQSIQKIIQKGKFPDWNSLVLGIG